MTITFKPLVPADEIDPAARFAPDRRFWPDGNGTAPPPAETAEEEQIAPADRARIEGYQRGWDDATAHAEQDQRQRQAAQEALVGSFARIDAAHTARLAERLHETVEALCHELIGDLAIDGALLARRTAAAAALFASADEGASLRLHPDDVALLGNGVDAAIAVQPDPALPRGEIRIDTPAGGIEDGPGNWRDAVTEALRSC